MTDGVITIIIEFHSLSLSSYKGIIVGLPLSPGASYPETVVIFFSDNGYSLIKSYNFTSKLEPNSEIKGEIGFQRIKEREIWQQATQQIATAKQKRALLHFALEIDSRNVRVISSEYSRGNYIYRKIKLVRMKSYYYNRVKKKKTKTCFWKILFGQKSKDSKEELAIIEREKP